MSERRAAMWAGVRVAQVWAEPLGGGETQVEAELSDGGVLLLKRSEADVARMMKRLVDGFPGDRETLSGHLLTGLLRIRTAERNADPHGKAAEMQELLRSIIRLPSKFSESEAVLLFFQPAGDDRSLTQEVDRSLTQEVDRSLTQEVDRSVTQEVDRSLTQEVDRSVTQEVDQTLQHELDLTLTLETDRTQGQEVDPPLQQEVDPSGQQEVDVALTQEVDPSSQQEVDRVLGQRFQFLSEVKRSNGFCLANTETILVDTEPPTRDAAPLRHAAARRADEPSVPEAEPGTGVVLRPLTPAVHLTFVLALGGTRETDILE